MYFIDRLDVFQDHPNGGLPIVGKELISRHDLGSGELLRATPNPKHHEGSYTTSLQIRCDGVRVSVEGNPSRWDRVDNLFGFQTFDECIEVYNVELIKLGLPVFTKTTKVHYLHSSTDTFKRITDGANFRRIDMTRNLSVGHKNEQHFLRGLSSQRVGKAVLPNLFPDGNTLMWKTGSWSTKLYNKAIEMGLSRNNKLVKKLNEKDNSYRNKIIKFCEDIGLIRDEKQFNQPFLNRNDLSCYGLIREKDFYKYLTDILNKIEISTMDYEHISDILIEQNICKSRQSANSTQSYVFAWLYGQTVKRNSQFYVHKARLAQLGIDISLPYDATRLMPQLRSNREIYVSTVLPPDWYKLPSVNNIRLVA